MKKFFAIALAFVMFASVNMFADTPLDPESNPSDDATVEVHVLQPITVVCDLDLVSFNIINGQTTTPDEDNILTWTIKGSGGHPVQWELTTAQPSLDGTELPVTYKVMRGTTEITGTAGVYSQNDLDLGTAHAENQEVEVSLEVTGIDASGTGLANGIYSADQTLVANYVL